MTIFAVFFIIKGEVIVLEEKDTAKIVEELKLSPDFTRFYDENNDFLVCESLAELLEKLLAEKGVKKADAVKNSDLNEVYAYQIFSGVRVPDRKKLLCLAFGMGLTIDETQRLLKCAGYPALYVKLPFDSVVLYGLTKRLDLIRTNEILYEYGQETLG